MVFCKYKPFFENKIILAYHGSNIPIKKFDKKFSSQGVFWFSDNKDTILQGKSGAVSTKYIMTVRLQVDKIAGWNEYDKLFLEEIKNQGYDSVKLDENWIIFDTKRIKVINIEQRK